MKEILLENKISWRKSADIDISENFYPSEFKKIIKKEQFLKENFEVKIVDVTEENINLFIELYLKEVVAKKDFVLDKKQTIEILKSKINDEKYKLMFIYFKEKIIFGWLFCFKEKGLLMAFRAFDRNFDEKLNKVSPITYWAEKIVFEYGKEKKVEFFSHGQDPNPYIKKSILGLPLFKLKTGVRPKILIKKNGEKNIKITFSIEEQKQKNNSFMFFTNPDKNDFFQDAYLYYPKGSLEESYVNEFKKVFEWAKLNLNVVEY